VSDVVENDELRPTDEDGYTARILTEPPDRDRFAEWAEASSFPGDVWELFDADGEVAERHVGDRGGGEPYTCAACDASHAGDHDCPEAPNGGDA